MDDNLNTDPSVIPPDEDEFFQEFSESATSTGATTPPASCPPTGSANPSCYTVCDQRCKEAIKNAKQVLKEGGCPVEITLKKPSCKKRRKYKKSKTCRAKAKCCKGKPCGRACIPRKKNCKS